MPFLLYILGGVFLLATLFPGVMNTLLVHARQRHRAEPEFAPFRPEELPAEAAEFFVRMAEALAREGFEPTGHMAWEPMTGQTVYQMMAANRETRDRAVAVHAKSGPENSPFSSFYLEFSTVFRNGTEIATHNNRQLSVVPSPREKRVFPFPQMTHPRRLYLLHRRLVSRFGGYEEPIPPARKTEVEALRNSVARDYRRLVRMRYLAPDETENVYRPTWKGAILTTWRIIWPISALRRMLLNRRGNRLINTLLVPGAE